MKLLQSLVNNGVFNAAAGGNPAVPQGNPVAPASADPLAHLASLANNGAAPPAGFPVGPGGGHPAVPSGGGGM
eukprot:1187019-Prorocentrum_minimum.AAC.1